MNYLYSSGNLDIVKRISKIAEANFDVKYNESKTLLHEACCSGNVELARFLVETGRVDVLAKSKEGKTLLHESNDNLQIMQYLLSLNTIDVNAKDCIFVICFNWKREYY